MWAKVDAKKDTNQMLNRGNATWNGSTHLAKAEYSKSTVFIRTTNEINAQNNWHKCMVSNVLRLEVCDPMEEATTKKLRILSLCLAHFASERAKWLFFRLPNFRSWSFSCDDRAPIFQAPAAVSNTKPIWTTNEAKAKNKNRTILANLRGTHCVCVCVRVSCAQ